MCSLTPGEVGAVIEVPIPVARVDGRSSTESTELRFDAPPQVMGVRLTGGDAQTKVEVMADVDPAAPLVYLTSIVNKRIRS